MLILYSTWRSKRLLPRSTTRTYGAERQKRQKQRDSDVISSQKICHSPHVLQLSHLFNGQLFEPRQGAGEEADDERGGGTDNIQHGGGEHGDVGVLPGEGVQQSHHSVATLRQSAVGRRKHRGEKQLWNRKITSSFQTSHIYLSVLLETFLPNIWV